MSGVSTVQPPPAPMQAREEGSAQSHRAAFAAWLRASASLAPGDVAAAVSTAHEADPTCPPRPSFSEDAQRFDASTPTAIDMAAHAATASGAPAVPLSDAPAHAGAPHVVSVLEAAPRASDVGTASDPAMVRPSEAAPRARDVESPGSGTPAARTAAIGGARSHASSHGGYPSGGEAPLPWALRRVPRALCAMAQGFERCVTLQVTQPELGTVTARVAVADGVAHFVLQCETEAATALMREQLTAALRDMHRQLAAAGLRLGSLAVGCRSRVTDHDPSTPDPLTAPRDPRRSLDIIA